MSKPSGGKTMRKPSDGETMRKSSGLPDNIGTAKHMRRTFEAKKKEERIDNSETAKDIRRSFEAYGGTIATLRKTCEEVSKRRKKKQRREKRLGRN